MEDTYRIPIAIWAKEMRMGKKKHYKVVGHEFS